MKLAITAGTYRPTLETIKRHIDNTIAEIGAYNFLTDGDFDDLCGNEVIETLQECSDILDGAY